jgi:hypothetical protein
MREGHPQGRQTTGRKQLRRRVVRRKKFHLPYQGERSQR